MFLALSASPGISSHTYYIFYMPFVPRIVEQLDFTAVFVFSIVKRFLECKMVKDVYITVCVCSLVINSLKLGETEVILEL